MTDRSPVIAFLRAHPAFAGTALYLYVSAVGSVYQWVYFSAFGINIFDFAEANDFLLAAFRRPAALVLLLSSLGIFGILMLASDTIAGFGTSVAGRLSEAKSRVTRSAGRGIGFLSQGGFWETRAGSWFVQTLIAVAFVAYTILPIVIFAVADARRTKMSAELVSVELRNSTEAYRLVFVGTTERFVFLYNRDTRSTEVIPVATVQRIGIPLERTP